jgi:poly(hydroxyalkanoate) granule-associated protein
MPHRGKARNDHHGATAPTTPDGPARRKTMAQKKDMQNDLAQSAHKIWLAGLGAVAMAEEEGEKLFKNLVEKGQGLESRGKEQVGKAKDAVGGVKTVAESYWETFEKTLDRQITGVLHRIGVPTKDEIGTLTKKVEELTDAIDKLRAADKKPAPKTTRRTTTKKGATA